MRCCPLCKASNACTYMKPTAWNNRHGMELKKCLQCNFVYSADSTFVYETFGNEFNNATKQELLTLAKKQQLAALADEIITKSNLKNGAVLDFGCGVGLLSLCMQERGFKTYGVELSEIYLKKHTELNIHSASCLELLGVSKNSFDLIIIKDLLEHVDHPQEMLSDILEYLKPNGYFYIRVPNVYHYPFHWSIDTQSHINHFTPKQLTALVQKNNMQHVDFIDVYDIRTQVGKLYHAVFWRMRNILPMYHQISMLFQKNS